jgi:hypothetical protein
LRVGKRTAYRQARPRRGSPGTSDPSPCGPWPSLLQVEDKPRRTRPACDRTLVPHQRDRIPIGPADEAIRTGGSVDASPHSDRARSSPDPLGHGPDESPPGSGGSGSGPGESPRTSTIALYPATLSANCVSVPSLKSMCRPVLTPHGHHPKQFGAADPRRAPSDQGEERRGRFGITQKTAKDCTEKAAEWLCFVNGLRRAPPVPCPVLYTTNFENHVRRARFSKPFAGSDFR